MVQAFNGAVNVCNGFSARPSLVPDDTKYATVEDGDAASDSEIDNTSDEGNSINATDSPNIQRNERSADKKGELKEVSPFNNSPVDVSNGEEKAAVIALAKSVESEAKSGATDGLNVSRSFECKHSSEDTDGQSGPKILAGETKQTKSALSAKQNVTQMPTAVNQSRNAGEGDHQGADFDVLASPAAPKHIDAATNSLRAEEVMLLLAGLLSWVD